MAEKEQGKEEAMARETVEELRARVSSFCPPEFKTHMMAARREFLMAVRSLLDARIESLERAEKAASKRATKVTVE